MDSGEKYDVIVIGGGASGLIAAGRAAERGLTVLLIEKNKHLGAKLSITGGGRCNITNAEEDERVLLSHYGNAEQFLYSPFSQFGMKDTCHFFESRRLPIVVEARKRAFPSTQKAQDVVDVLVAYVKKGNVDIQTGTPITNIVCENGSISHVVAGKVIYRATHYILATGGVSHPETGSTGDGYAFLSALGHTVEQPTPTIVPLATKELWSKKLAGVSLSFMKITFFLEGKRVFSKTGKLLFTHFGLSGPLILNSAVSVADLLHTGAVTATVDAYPDTDLGSLERRIISVFDVNKNKTLRTVLKEIVPKGMAKGIEILLEDKVDIDTRVHSVSKEDRKVITHLLKALPITIEGLMGFDRAVIADGGVVLSEIDTRTMQSKKVSNLFVTGDLLHINRPSGGYSLQLCWTTGYVAGNHVATIDNID